MKRLCCVFLVLVMLVSMFAVGIQAAAVPELTISSGSAKPGESVLLKVSIKDNPGIAATMIYIYYDTNTFEVSPKKDISAAGAFASSGGIIGNTIEKAKENGRYDGVAGKDGVLALWYDSSGTDVDADGALLTVRLHVKEQAVNGEYAVQLGVAGNSTIDENNRYYDMKTTGGMVTVTGGAEQTTTQTPNQTETNVTDIPVAEFTDVSGNWAERYIKQAAELKLIEGYLGKYRPNDTMTRAEFVTILWRAFGRPQPKNKTTFKDLTQDWYKDAVAWAEENAIVNGMSEGVFAPNGNVTREQLVTILHRMSGAPVGMEMMLTGIYDSQYPDSGEVGSWAKSALYWSIYNGIYCGVKSEQVGTTLNPRDPADRAQIAVMIVRYLNMDE